MINNMISQNKLIQFLMGLNESYDSIRTQILVLDPLPMVNKAYSMVLRVNKHRAVQIDLTSSTESSAMLVKTTQHGNSKGTVQGGTKRKMIGYVSIARL